MAVSFEVSVAKESIGFSAAHFLTLPGHLCERLHGHNYRVGATVTGTVDSTTGFVVDFALLKRILRDVVERMDHRVLVPTGNPDLSIREEDDSVLVDYTWPAWLVVPRAHACLLPVRQTTAELLARLIGVEVWTTLEIEGTQPQTLELEVEESRGQVARYRIDHEPTEEAAG